jgi:hypothetical protein
MRDRIQFAILGCTLFIFLIDRTAARAQNAEPFKFFREYVGLNEGQIATIRNGKAIAGVLDSRAADS